MSSNNTAGLQISGTTTQLEQALSHLRIAPSTENDPTCQLCKEPITEGDKLTLYLYKPAGSSGYDVGQCRCRRHDDGLTGLFTLGVDELIVDGRVGQCRDHATQQTWPVLVSPTVQLISAGDTTTGRAPAEPQTDTPTWCHGEHLRERIADDQPPNTSQSPSQSKLQMEGHQ